MNLVKWTIVLALGLILVLLVVQNTASVKANILWFSAEMSLVVLLFLTGAVGFVSGLVFGFLLNSRGAKTTEEQPNY